MMVQAKRDVGIFEELTVDYGDGYWMDRECRCGAKRCQFSKEYKEMRDEQISLELLKF